MSNVRVVLNVKPQQRKGLLYRLQHWVGNMAPVDTPSILVWTIGIRHINVRPILGNQECPKVHRSWGAWTECMLGAWRDDYMELGRRRILSIMKEQQRWQ